MPVMSETFISVSEQRAIEKAAKAAKVAKKRAALQTAIDNGAAADTEINSKLVKAAWIKDAGTQIVINFERQIGARSEGISPEKRDLLRAYLKPSDKGLDHKDNEVVLNLANQFAKITFNELLNVVFTTSGEVVLGTSIFESQKIQALFKAVAAQVVLELDLLQLCDSNPSSYYSLFYVLNNPAYSTDAKKLAQQAALRGLNAFEQVNAWMADKAHYVMPDGKAISCGLSTKEADTVAGFFLEHVTAAVPESNRFWQIKRIFDDNGHVNDYVVISDDLNSDAVLDEISARALYRGPVESVVSWQENEFGGTVLNGATHEHTFIRGHQHRSSAGQTVLKCVDNAQNVRYVVNDFILEIARELSNEKCKFGKFVSPKGTHYTKSLRTKQALVAAAEWQGRSFVSAWNVDYRGRMYPISSVLTIQSTDFEKSLLKFAEFQPVTKETAYWLSVHLANTYANDGVDKLPLDARVEWVHTHSVQQLILDGATNPVAMIRDWMADDSTAPSEPWEFIAACEEFYALYLAPVDQRRAGTNLPVAVDASCSGIQVLSGLIKDAAAGKLVNVTPSDTKQDAYAAVAEIVQDKLSKPVKLTRESVGEDGKKKRVKHEVDLSAYKHLVTRSVVKKLVMTLAYNAAARSQGEYIKEALKPVKDQINAEHRSDFYSAVGVLGRAAMEKLLPQVISLKKWMAAAAQKAAAEKGVLYFTTPSGMTLGQQKNEVETVTLRTAFAGKAREITLAIGIKNKVQVGQHKTCTMPNVVHALDASLLHVAFADFDKPFALIHDSVLATATDISKAIDSYKQSYVTHFTGDDTYNDLISMFDADSFPETGKLVIKDVVHSQFFLA